MSSNNYEKAIESYHDVIELCRAVDEYQVELSTLVNVASLLINQEKSDQAITYLTKAIERYNEIPEGQDSIIAEIRKNLLPGIYINTGICYDKLEKQDTALIVYEQALDAIEYIDNAYYVSYLRSYVYNNMAYIHLDYKEWTKAKENYALALKFASEIENPQGILQAKTGLSGVSVKLQDYNNAEVLLMESLTMAQKENNLERQVEVLKYYSEYYDSIRDYQSSLDYRKAYDTLNLKLINENRDKIQQDRETFYKTKEKEDELLIQTLRLKEEETQRKNQLIFFIISLIGVMALAYILYSRYKLRKERQSAEFEKNLNVAMARFVPTKFIESIGRNHITEVKLGDRIEKEITVIFTDIRNFTSRSEKMTPGQTFQFIKNYAEQMGPIIQKNGGFINQYLGDGLMAVFQNNPEDALIACIEMHSKLISYNKELEQSGIEAVEVGMGLHTGPAVMGIIGDEERRDATMISDTINTAARMESQTKHYGVKILISEESRKRLRNPELYKLRHIGAVKVKGKEKPIDIYECFNADTDDSLLLKESSIHEFDTAVDHFYKRDYTLAKSLLLDIKRKNPTDKVTASFIDEIDKLNTLT